MVHSSDTLARAITDINELPSIEAEWRALHDQNKSLSFFASYDFIWHTCRFLLSQEDTIYIVTFRVNQKLVAVVPLFFTKKRHSGLSYTALELIGCREGDRPGISSIISPENIWATLQLLLEREERHWQVLHLGEMDPNSVNQSILPWFRSSRYSCFLERDRISYGVTLRGTFEEYLRSRPPGVQRLYRRHLRATERRFGPPELVTYTGQSAADEGLHRYCEIERKSRKLALGITLASNPARVEFYRALCANLAPAESARVFIWSAGGEDLAGSLTFVHGNHAYEREIAFNQQHQATSPGILLQSEMFKHYFGLGLDEFDLLGMHPSHGEPQHKIDWATTKRETYRFSAVINCSRLLPWICLQKWKRKEAVYENVQPAAA